VETTDRKAYLGYEKKKHTWSESQQKFLTQVGQPYVSRKPTSTEVTKAVPLKLTKCRCATTRKSCGIHSDVERAAIFYGHLKLRPEEKRMFIAQHVQQIPVQFHRSKKNKPRDFTYQYYLPYDKDDVIVCKQYFLDTLSISESVVYRVFGKRHTGGYSNVPLPHLKGKGPPAHATKPEDREFAIDHLKSLPKIASHYCRANTKRKYFEHKLTPMRLYRIYKEHCIDNLKEPLSERIYRDIRVGLNVYFFAPKKDQCLKCFTERKDEKLPGWEPSEVLVSHREEIAFVRVEKEVDKDLAKQDGSLILLDIDLQKTILTPQSHLGNLYYLRKLCNYNQTGYCYTLDSEPDYAICVLWEESISGKQATTIASACMEIVKRSVAKNPTATMIIEYRDNCAAQNKNKVMSTAILDFLNNDQSHCVTTYIQKYGVPCHSSVTAVDTVHSIIENDIIRVNGYIHSPLHLNQLIANHESDKLKHFETRYMTEKYLQDYKRASDSYGFAKVQISKAKSIEYTKGSTVLKLKHSFAPGAEIIEIDIAKPNCLPFPVVSPVPEHEMSLIDAQKIKQIRSVQSVRPEDKMFYESMFRKVKERRPLVERHLAKGNFNLNSF
jgi:hypothetical protein